MRTYKFKLRSQLNTLFAILLFFLILGPLLYLRSKFIPIAWNDTLLLVFWLLMMLILFFLMNHIASAKVEWSIDDNGFNIKWVKQFFMTPENKDISVRWSEVETLSKGYSFKFDKFKIILASGDKLKFYHDVSFFRRDDYFEFEKDLFTTYRKVKLPDR